MRLVAIVPKRPLLKGDPLRELRKAIDATRGPIEADLKAVTATWQTKVRFRVRFTAEGGALVLAVTTTNKIFGYVNEGTKPHVIRPKTSHALRFRTGYVAKTQPGLLRSGQGGARGPWAAARIVRHPGTVARKFTETIARKHRRLFVRNVQAAIRRTVGK